MSGLDKLIKHIEDDAESTAKAIMEQAEHEADEMIASAKAEAGKKREEIDQQSAVNVQDYISRGESAALLQERRMLLEAKQKMIGDVIAKAKETLLTLPDPQYFDILLRMIQKNARSQSGQILFSSSDKKRLPPDFGNSIRTALSEKSGASLTISNDTRNINGGFVLLYGDVEENCSFDDLFAAAKESLQDKVGALLFN